MTAREPVCAKPAVSFPGPGSRWWDRATADLDELAERLGVAVEDVPAPLAKHGLPSDRAIHAAAEIYGAILADPERADQIRAARAAHATAHNLDFCLYCAISMPRGGQIDPTHGPTRPCTHRSGVHCLRADDQDQRKEA